MLGANDVRVSRLMDRREAPGRKRMGIRSPDGAARHPISSPPAPFLLCRLLFPPIIFVRFATPSVELTREWGRPSIIRQLALLVPNLSRAQRVLEIFRGVPAHVPAHADQYFESISRPFPRLSSK